MKKIPNLIEELSCSKTNNDLWDTYKEEYNTNGIFLYFMDDQTITLRFLGPFIQAHRFYIAPIKFIRDSIDINGIGNKDQIAINNALNVVEKCSKDRAYSQDCYNDMRKFLSTIQKKATWQKCVMVNACVRNETALPSLKIAVLTKQLCNAIIEKVPLNTKINGINAHDISIRKHAPVPVINTPPFVINRRVRPHDNSFYGSILDEIQTSLNLDANQTVSINYANVTPERERQYSAPNFHVNIENQTSLSEQEIRLVINEGLWDIPTVIKSMNKNSAYVYKCSSNYKMPSEFMTDIASEIRKKEEDNHFEEVDKNFNDIPAEAFENRNRNRGAIGSIEIV
jgi:hypothetical protein